MAQREWEKFEKNIYGKGTFAKSSFENRHDDLPDEEEKLELHQVEVEESNKEPIESSQDEEESEDIQSLLESLTEDSISQCTDDKLENIENKEK